MAVWTLVAITGFVVSGVVALRPKLFWPVLIVVTVGTGGLIFRSLGLTDEILTGGVLVGGFMAMLVGAFSLRRGREDAWEEFHKLIFLVMIIYMIVQSLRGLLILESLRKIRWIAYYGMLGVVPFVISHKDRPFTSPRKIAFIISSIALIYFSLYFFHGLFSEVVRGLNRYSLQNLEWGGTTYAMFPLAITMPAVLLLLKDKKPVYRRVGWATLMMAIVAAFYYDSRVAWLVILGFIIISIPVLGFRKFVRFAVIFLFITGLFVLFIWPEWYTFDLFWKGLIDASQSLWASPGEHHVFRKVQLEIAFPIISSSDKTFFFGHGFRVGADLIGEHTARLWVKYVPHLSSEAIETIRRYGSTNGFTALVVETGSVGLLLLCMNFLFVARGIFIRKSGGVRILLLSSLAVTFLWLFICNLVDFVLFYLMIMPSGLLLQLSKYGGERVIEKKGD